MVSAMNTNLILTEAEKTLLNDLKTGLDSAAHQSDSEMFSNAYNLFSVQGLPSRRVERWKYTDLRNTLKTRLPQAGNSNIDPSSHLEDLVHTFGTKHLHVDVINGRIDHKTLPAGLNVNSDASLIGVSESTLSDIPALNAASTQGAQELCLDPKHCADSVLHLNHVIANGVSTAPHIKIVVPAGVCLTVVETTSSHGTYHAFEMCEVTCLDGAHVKHFIFNTTAEKDSVSLTQQSVILHTNANYETILCQTGAAFGRREVCTTFEGEGAHAGMKAIVIGKNTEHFDVTLNINHKVPNCTSEEFYRFALDDHATGVYQGKIIVAPHAQKTDSAMRANGLLLSDNAAFFIKPELEIFADDVMCGHGATSASLDKELMFYLNARGIAGDDAKKMLVEAFAAEIYEGLEDEGYYDAIIAKLKELL